jgi:hypothetical protein
MAVVAVQPDDQLLTSGRRQSFSSRWIERLPELGHQVRVVDLFQPEPLEQLVDCDGLMWWFAHMPFPRNFGRRFMMALNHARNFSTFPNTPTCWHFDDKVAQYYLLKAAGLPMPATWVFWRREDAKAFCRTASYPLVLKLAGGIISENVRLLRSRRQAEHWIGEMFGPGATSLKWPSFQDATAVAGTVASTLHRAFTGQALPSRRSELQRGYFLLQEFVEGNDHDTRAVAIGNRAWVYRRLNRPKDFRASGSGLRDPERSRIDLEMVRLAFVVARALGTQSIAVDGIYRGSERVLTEVSYYYEGWILFEECQGHWVLHGTPETGRLEWVDEQLRPEDAILDEFLASLSAPSAVSGLVPQSSPSAG